jgi:polar amino acid transport system permease protein
MNTPLSWIALLGFGDTGWGDELLRGAALSASIAACAYVVGLALGLLGAIAKISGPRGVVALANLYTTVIRSLPDILVIFLIYYSASDAIRSLVALSGLSRDFEVNGFVAATLALGVVMGGYTTEVIRGAILAIPKGQGEAAHALGLSAPQTFGLITLPQALPLALPGLGNLWLVVLKESSLVSLIGFTELVLAGRMAAGATRHYLLFYSAVGATFLIMSALSGLVLQNVEQRFDKARKER